MLQISSLWLRLADLRALLALLQSSAQALQGQFLLCCHMQEPKLQLAQTLQPRFLCRQALSAQESSALPLSSCAHLQAMFWLRQALDPMALQLKRISWLHGPLHQKLHVQP